MRVYDPRDNAWKESDNPSLVLLYTLLTSCCPLEDSIWEESITWANMCEQEIGINWI